VPRPRSKKPKGPEIDLSGYGGLPGAIEAERAILGAVCLDNKLYGEVAAAISGDDLVLDSHRRIYAAMRALADASKPIDLVTLTDELKAERAIDQVGGIVYIADLTTGLPRRPRVDEYCRLVRDKARSRALILAATKAQYAVLEGEKVDDALASLEIDTLAILGRGRRLEARSAEELARSTFEDIYNIRESKQTLVGLTTGHEELDRLTTGYRAGEYYILAARTGKGKSALMVQGARAQVRGGRKPAIMSIEMSGEAVIMRAISLETGIDHYFLRDPRLLDEYDLDKVAQAAKAIGQWPWMIDDAAGITRRELLARCRMHIARGAEIIYVDYLQYVSDPDIPDRYERVTAVSGDLRDLSKQTNVPIVALSQLKRAKDENEEPSIHDLKESGNIENDAHAVVLIHRPKERGRYTGNDKLIIGKQRSGLADVYAKTYFNGPTMEFRPRSADYVPVEGSEPEMPEPPAPERRGFAMDRPQDGSEAYAE